jgi:hypothetical protein
MVCQCILAEFHIFKFKNMYIIFIEKHKTA